MSKNGLELIIFKYECACGAFHKKTDAGPCGMPGLEVNGSEVKNFSGMLKK
jgi:hypothetical protein